MTKIAITALVGVHLIVVIWHSLAHIELAVGLPPEKTVFVYAVIVIAPLVAASLVWTRFVAAAIWLFFLSMLGSLVFGVYHHYVLVSPDHIAHLPAGSDMARSQFIASAGFLALVELFAALCGAFIIGFHHARRTQV